MNNRILQIGNALSQLLNTIVHGFSDESFSSRSYRRSLVTRRWKVALYVIDKIFGEGHCKAAYESELARAQMPPELRDPPRP